MLTVDEYSSLAEVWDEGERAACIAFRRATRRLGMQVVRGWSAHKRWQVRNRGRWFQLDG